MGHVSGSSIACCSFFLKTGGFSYKNNVVFKFDYRHIGVVVNFLIVVLSFVGTRAVTCVQRRTSKKAKTD